MNANSIPVPNLVNSDESYFQIINLWVSKTKDAPVVSGVRTLPFDHDIGAIGLLLVDLARHFAITYIESETGRQQEYILEKVLTQIKRSFDEEWDNPTLTPDQWSAPPK